jgi:hypothetical protein
MEGYVSINISKQEIEEARKDPKRFERFFKKRMDEYIASQYLILRDYFGIPMDQFIEVSKTTGWRRIFFWRKRVLKSWREILQAHIDDHSSDF